MSANILHELKEKWKSWKNNKASYWSRLRHYLFYSYVLDIPNLIPRFFFFCNKINGNCVWHFLNQNCAKMLRSIFIKLNYADYASKYKKTLKYGQRILALHANVIMHNAGPPCARENRLLKLTQNLTCVELFRKEKQWGFFSVPSRLC